MADKLLSRKDLAALTGTSLAAVDVAVHRSDNPIPHMRFGRKILFDATEAVRWMRKQAGRREKVRA